MNRIVKLLILVLVFYAGEAFAQWVPDPINEKRAETMSNSPFSLPSDLEKKSVTSNTSSISANELFEKGLQSAKETEFSLAERYFKHAADLAPGDSKIWTNLGLAYRRQGKLNSAKEAYLKSIEADPNFALAYKNLAILLEEKGDFAAAVKTYLKYSEKIFDNKEKAKAVKRAAWIRQTYLQE